MTKALCMLAVCVLLTPAAGLGTDQRMACPPESFTATVYVSVVETYRLHDYITPPCLPFCYDHINCPASYGGLPFYATWHPGGDGDCASEFCGPVHDNTSQWYCYYQDYLGTFQDTWQETFSRGGTVNGIDHPCPSGIDLGPAVPSAIQPRHNLNDGHGFPIEESQGMSYTLTVVDNNPNVDVFFTNPWGFTTSTDPNTHIIACTEPCADCEVAPTNLSFSVSTIGGSQSQSFTVTNSGIVTFNGTVSASCPEFTVTPASYTLGAGGSESFTVTYTPQDCGNDNCIVETGNSLCSDVSCTTIGPSSPVCSVNPANLTFAVSGVGGSESKTFVITNMNTGCATLGGTVSAPCPGFTVAPTSYSLVPGTSETFTVTYTCQSADETGSCVIGTGTACGDIICDYSCPGPDCPDCPSLFTWTDNTGSTYSIVIDSATWEGGMLPDCSEIAVFDGDLCVGAVCWSGTQVGLPAWCDDSQTPEIDGYICGNPMSFMIYNYATGEICGAVAVYTQGNGDFCDGPFALVSVDASCCQEIQLSTGWNCISSYVAPIDPSMTAVWAEVIDAGHLNIVKNDCTGDFCIPGLTCMMDWDPYSCYLAHLSAPDALSVCGSAVPEEGPVSLDSGWNCLPFLPRTPQAPAVALASCWDDINIVKSNCTGEFCIPGLICMIDWLDPGDCYMIHMSQTCDLYYPTRGLLSKRVPSKVDAHTRIRAAHFGGTSRTGATYSVVIAGADGIMNTGDEIGVFSGDMCVGSRVWVSGPVLGIPVWGDDVSTDVVDGCLPEDQLTFRLWDARSSEESDIDLTYTAGDGTYGCGPYLLAKIVVSKTSATGDREGRPVDRLSQNYPNPFRTETSISFELSKSGWVTVKVFNVRGEQVRSLVDRFETVGDHRVIWDGKNDTNEDLSAGIYFYRIEVGHFRAMRKMMLLK